MFEVAIGFSVFALLCLATKALRLYGVVGIAVLSMLFPIASLLLGITAGIVILLFHQRHNLPIGVSNALSDLVRKILA